MNRTLSLLAGIVAIPLFASAQALPTTPPAGYDQRGQYPAGTVQWNVPFYSSVAGSNVTMHVYTPPNYNPGRKYGVVYCYQGISAGADTTFADWNVYANGLADILIAQGKIKPVIIVALDDQFAGTYSDVAGMTIKDAIPYIDSHYSTYADADHRGVYGYSWGGGYAFNVGCGNLDTFHYIAPSSAAPSKAGDDALFPNGGAEAKEKMKLLLISCGNADWLGLYGSSEGAHNYCVANGIPHVWWPVNQGNHDAGSVWRPHMWNFLQMADAAGISDPPLTRSAYAQNEAEDFDQRIGVGSENCIEGGKDIGSIQSGAYAAFNNVDFGTGATNFQARVASATSGGTIEIRLDGANGTLVGACAVPGTGNWQTWTTVTTAVSGATGIHTVFLRFTGGAGYLFNVNWWKFGGPVSPVSVPSAPVGLVATAGTERAVLRWTASTGATGYNVKRSVTNGAYITIAAVAGTNYTDRSAIGGITYDYKVSALNLGGESADSASVGVIPILDVLMPWVTRDIGFVGLSGSASFSNGVFTVAGCGADIGSAADAFRFVHVPATNDCTIVARVGSLESHISPWSKAGVMIRASLETNAANAFIGLTPGNGVTWQYRLVAGGATISNNTTGLSAPCWVKLVRNGNTFNGYYSVNGTSWTPMGGATIPMGSVVQAGLALSSHNLYTLCAGMFDHVTAPGWAPLPVTAPTGLTATAGVEQVALNWTASANATSYNVKRATTTGGPYTTIATVVATNYNDTTAIARTRYYYVVSALSTLAGESANSPETAAIPISPVPLPWQTRNIGTVGSVGGAGVTNEVFTVSGSGDDIWNTADAFRFVYVTNSGNFTITARVVSMQNVDAWSKAGVMIRGSLDAGAANAFVAVTPGNGVTFQFRASAGGNSDFFGAPGLSAPYWVRLVRNGDTFTGYRSANGVSWTGMGSTTISMGTTVYAGLAVTAHNNTALCSAAFDNVTVPGWPPPLLTLDAVAAASIQVNLNWNSLANATSYNLKRSTTSGGPYTAIASGLTATNFTDTVASVRNSYYYVVSAMIGGVETTNSPEAAIRFPKLTGTIIGTSGSWNNSGNTIAKVFDEDLATFFDAPIGNGAWAGLDFGAGESNLIVRINYCPRAGSESRMVGGVFQGANQAGFSDAITLATVSAQPAAGVFTSVSIPTTTAFRYVRYLSPDGGFGNVAEVEFLGCPFAASTPATSAPTGLEATAVANGEIALKWNALTGATGYNVKRSTTNGGPYVTIAGGVTATNYTDNGLAGGTMYYYVVSAVLDGVETAPSAQASAATFSPVAGSLVHRYRFDETGGGIVADSVGGPVWNGALPNGGTLAGGQLALSSGFLQYATLPAGIVSGLSNITIIAWVNLSSVSYWSPVFDFGDGADSYMFLTPRNGFDHTMRFAITTGGPGGEQKINCAVAVNPDGWHQVAVTMGGGVGILYLDGSPMGTNSSLTIPPSALGATVNNYIGKSESAYPYLDGALAEFRIHNEALTAQEIAATAAMGPDQLLSTNSPAMSVAVDGANLSLSWPLAHTGFTVQSCTNLTAGDWENVASPAPQIVGDRWQVTLPCRGDAVPAFYRLSK